MEQKLAELGRILPFWSDLNATEKDILMENTKYVAYNSGEHVHAGGADCTGVIVVEEGELRAYILSESGKEITLYRLLDNDICILSASCILKKISFDIHIDAQTTTKMYIINVSAYEKIEKSNPSVERFTNDIIKERFSDAMWIMEQVLFMSFDKRLAIFLLEQSEVENSDTITLTHETIARHMGSAREVVSRMLKHFQREGLVTVARSDIRILNRTKLISLSENI